MISSNYHCHYCCVKKIPVVQTICKIYLLFLLLLTTLGSDQVLILTVLMNHSRASCSGDHIGNQDRTIHFFFSFSHMQGKNSTCYAISLAPKLPVFTFNTVHNEIYYYIYLLYMYIFFDLTLYLKNVFT